MVLEYSSLDSDAIPEIKADAILRDAERLVAYYAPNPSSAESEVPNEAYISAASDAEMRLWEYLAATEGYLTSTGVAGVNESFVDFDKVKAIVLKTMATISSNPTSKLRSIPMARG